MNTFAAYLSLLANRLFVFQRTRHQLENWRAVGIAWAFKIDVVISAEKMTNSSTVFVMIAAWLYASTVFLIRHGSWRSRRLSALNVVAKTSWLSTSPHPFWFLSPSLHYSFSNDPVEMVVLPIDSIEQHFLSCWVWSTGSLALSPHRLATNQNGGQCRSVGISLAPRFWRDRLSRGLLFLIALSWLLTSFCYRWESVTNYSSCPEKVGYKHSCYVSWFQWSTNKLRSPLLILTLAFLVP